MKSKARTRIEKYNELQALVNEHTPTPTDSPETIENLIAAAVAIAFAFTMDATKSRDLLVILLNQNLEYMASVLEQVKKEQNSP